MGRPGVAELDIDGRSMFRPVRLGKEVVQLLHGIRFSRRSNQMLRQSLPADLCHTDTLLLGKGLKGGVQFLI